MLKKILFLVMYLFCWVVFFELARVFFIFSTLSYARETPASLIAQSLWYGLRMDISMAGYITVPVCFFIICSLFFPLFKRKGIYFFYTGLVFFLQLFLIGVDAEVYKAWGTRIDSTPIKYLSSPAEMWASVSHFPLLLVLLIFISVYIILFWIFRKIITRLIILIQNNQRRLVQALLVLLFTGALIIPIRGGMQLSPLNQSSVYFCNQQYANIAAINASWNFMYAVSLMNQMDETAYQYLPEAEANTIVDSLFAENGNTMFVLPATDTVKPNVLLIIWESFTAKALNKVVDNKPVIPFFPELIKEGIYFSNCYSSGDRTDKGISAVLSSYPALPKGSIVNYPEKTAKLQGLGNLFLQNGYSTHFYYGGEPEFANIKSYLSAQEFQQLTTKNDFSAADMNSKWGAHDDVVMKRLKTDIEKMQQPFFTTWLTLSSHEPFETPVAPVFTAKDKETKFFNSLHYTDSVIYTFINELKKLPSWKNTLVIISADHGHYLPVTGKRADDYHIPVLWLGGILEKSNLMVSKTTSQLDIAGSLAQQLHFTDHPFRFSKNVFDTSSKHWAFFTYNDGVGFVTDSSRLLFDNAGKRTVFEEGKANAGHERIAKALMQKVYTDFIKR